MKKILYILGSLIFAISLFVILNGQSKAMASCGGDDTASFLTAGSLDCGDETYFYDPRNSADHGSDFIVFERYPANDKEDRIVITASGDAYLIAWRDCQSTTCGDPIELDDYANAVEPLEEGGTEYCSIILRTDCLPITASSIFNAAASVARPPLINPARYTGPVPEILRGEGPNSLRGILLARGLSEELDDSCEEQVNNPLSFILCPLLRIGTETVDELTGFLEDRLKFEPLTDFRGTGGGNPIQQGFNRFRNIANSLYILIFLVIILSNFISVGLDNYSIKKMLPRLLVAVIGTQFAFLICSVVVDLSNVLVVSLPSVVGTLAGGPTSIGEGLTDQFANVVSGDGVVRLLSGTAAVILILIICFALLGVILIALAYIVFRNVFLLVLVFLSPVAIAAWVLPQTQNFAKKWGTWFVKLIVMGPIISLILAITLIVQDIFSRSSDGFMQFVAFLVPFIGFAIIPKSLKWSGDVVGAAGRIGKVTDKVGGAAKDKAGKKAKEQYNKASGYTGEKFGRGASALTRGRYGAKMEARGTAKREAPKEEVKKAIESLDFDRQIKIAQQGKGKAGQAAKELVGAKQSELVNKRVLSGSDVKKLVQLKRAGMLKDPDGHLDQPFTDSMGIHESGRDLTTEELTVRQINPASIPSSVQNPFWTDQNNNQPNNPPNPPNNPPNPPNNPPTPPPTGGNTGGATNAGGAPRGAPNRRTGTRPAPTPTPTPTPRPTPTPTPTPTPRPTPTPLPNPEPPEPPPGTTE